MLDEALALRRETTLTVKEADFLAASPRSMAEELIDTRDMVKYLTYGVAILAFFVWILLISRR